MKVIFCKGYSWVHGVFYCSYINNKEKWDVVLSVEMEGLNPVVLLTLL